MEEKILQDKLDEIVTEIVRLEDEISLITNEMKAFEISKLKQLEDIDLEVLKNNENLRNIDKNIKNEELTETREIKIKEEEKGRIASYIKDIENEIVNLKKKDLEKLKEKELLDKKYEERNQINQQKAEILEKKRKEQEKEMIENAKKNYEIKKGIINLEIQKLQDQANSLNENFEKANAIKNNYETELVNLISQKETFEEVVKNFTLNNKNTIADINDNYQDNNHLLRNSASSFKNMNFSNYNNNNLDDEENYLRNSQKSFYKKSNYINNNYLNTIKNCEISEEELKVIDKNTIGKAIYDNLFELDTKISLLDKDLFARTLKSAFESLIDNHGIFTTDDIIVLITKKIFDLMSENKSFSDVNPFTSEKLRNFIKYVIKIQYYDSLINSKFDFVNIIFENEKLIYEKEINEINLKIHNFKNQLEKLSLKQKSVHLDSPMKENKSSFLDFSNNESPYLKAIAKLDEKLLELIEQKNEIELKIIQIKQNSGENIDKLKAEITIIENTNNDLKTKKSLIPSEVEQNKIKCNEKIIFIRNEIADKFQRIKIIFNSTDNVNNQNNLLESCIDKIKQSVNDFKASVDFDYHDKLKENSISNSPFKNNPMKYRKSIENNSTIRDSIDNSNYFPLTKKISAENLYDHKQEDNLRYEKNDFACIPYSIALKNSKKKTQNNIENNDLPIDINNTPLSKNNIHNNSYLNLEPKFRKSQEKLNSNSKNVFNDRSSLFYENDANNILKGNIENLNKNANMPQSHRITPSLNYSNLNDYLERKNPNFKNANQSFHTCKDFQYINNYDSPEYFNNNNNDPEINFNYNNYFNNNKSFQNYSNAHNTPFRTHRYPSREYPDFNNENNYENSIYPEASTNYGVFSQRNTYNKSSKKNSCHSLGSLRIPNSAYSTREPYQSKLYCENMNCPSNINSHNLNNYIHPCNKCEENYQNSSEDEIDNFNKYQSHCKNCQTNIEAKAMKHPETTNSSTQRYFLNNGKNNANSSYSKTNSNNRSNKKPNQNKSCDISYLKEKYEKNKKTYEDTQKKLEKDTNLKNQSPTKRVTNSKVFLNNSKKSKIEKPLKMKTLSEKEILNNSIKNIKNEITSRCDMDYINNKLKQSRKSMQDEFISIQEPGIIKMTDKYNEFIDNQTASRISSIANNFTKESADKKLNQKLIKDYINTKLLQGQHSKKVNILILYNYF